MEVFGCGKYVGVVFLFLLWSCALFANAQTGFLSIDCGGGNRIDPETHITWVSDDDFIHNVGEKADSYYSYMVKFYFRRLRVFPKPINKACYVLPLAPNVPHILRLSFVSANSTGYRDFNYSVETQDLLYMETVVFDNCLVCRSGNTLLSADSVLHICLIRTSDCADPSISAIELRRLKPGMYDTAKPGIMLHTDKRCDMGAEDVTRYPQDQFDRMWEPCKSLVTGTKSINVPKSISVSGTRNFPPSKVMQTAVVSNTSGSNNMYFSLGQSRSKNALAVLYFAELNSTGKRSFSVGINNVILTKEIDLAGNVPALGLPFQYDGTTEAIVNLQSKIPGVSPIINALEIHALFYTHPRTSSDDVKALRELGKAFSLNSWTSDPCFGLPWEGIICSNINNTVRISQINLSGRNLQGPIPSSLGQLTELVSIFSGNKHLCPTKRKCRNHPRSVVAIALGVAGIVIVTAILVGIIIYRFKLRSPCTQPSPLDYLMVNVANSSKCRAFTLEEMRTATQNFTHKIGHGSFGTVFLGELQEGKQIAVKVLSVFNKHGIEQFSNEVDLLSRINHKKLVSFLGYCNESRDLMLVYEYMSGGSLSDNLYGAEPPKYSQLDWKTRLQIALDAAQGLEYLHVGCTPKIIHRDVKTSNILLDSNLNGKLADFGLSRVTGNDETSQINTTIKGTPGYLDPMYYKTHMLTDKSDVYSFGVVLFELICGRKPIDTKVSAEKILLTEWVTSYAGVDKDDANIQEMVDKRLGNRYNMKSIAHLTNLAWRCIANEPSGRPTISEVVAEIKESVKFEEEYCHVPDQVSLTLTSSFSSSL
ncbi:receptor-like protein kinase At3g21340 isoform X6 [Cryptomeria japonica]|uniref:receptor-like protein kinase At3g21340 isoform X6 n=1 Tax=Cryptomeria japonica TaxID=3369 RepID=UPI0027DAAB92|nr:receptor-like protein kinase At3g21340 isoform X6 [Cryptomeria japonica]